MDKKSNITEKVNYQLKMIPYFCHAKQIDKRINWTLSLGVTTSIYTPASGQGASCADQWMAEWKSGLAGGDKLTSSIYFKFKYINR